MITRSYTHQLVKRGKLTKGPCEVCGILYPVEAHHENYNNPWRVRWLCKPHHDHITFERKK